MAITTPTTYPRPDPAQHLAGSPLIGDDATSTRDWTDLGRALNYLRRYGRAQPCWHQQWIGSRFAASNVRSGGPAPEGAFRTRIRIPELPLRTKVRVGVEATMAAGTNGLVEFRSINSGTTIQFTIPAATTKTWFWSGGVGPGHLSVTWGAPIAPGLCGWEDVWVYTSADAAAQLQIHGLAIQHLPLSVAAGVDGAYRPFDDLDLDAQSSASCRLAHWLLDVLGDFDDWVRYPRSIFAWAGVDLSTIGNLPLTPLRAHVPINADVPDDHRKLEAHVYMGDPLKIVDSRLDLVFGDPQDVPWLLQPDPVARVSPHSMSFQRAAALGEGWQTPQVGTWPNRRNVPSPRDYAIGTLDVLGSVPGVVVPGASAEVHSISVWM